MTCDPTSSHFAFRARDCQNINNRFVKLFQPLLNILATSCDRNVLKGYIQSEGVFQYSSVSFGRTAKQAKS